MRSSDTEWQRDRRRRPPAVLLAEELKFVKLHLIADVVLEVAAEASR